MAIARNNILKDENGVLIQNVAGPIISETIDLADYDSYAVQVNGTGIGNVIFEVSNDRVNWIQVQSVTGDSPIGLDICKTSFRYARVQVDAGADLEIYFSAKGQ